MITNNDEFDSDGSTKKKGCNPKTAFWVLAIIGAALLITGAILLPIGLVQQKSAGSLEPQSDFTLLDQSCTITEAIYGGSKQEMCSRKQGNSNVRYKCGCTDYWSYTIYAPQLADIDDYYIGRGDGYKFGSRTVGIKRNGDDCNLTLQEGPHWSTGSTTSCWRPSTPGKDPPKQYRCGNDECIKVFSPQLDADKADSVAKAFWISGTTILGLSVVFIAVACHCRKKM